MLRTNASHRPSRTALRSSPLASACRAVSSPPPHLETLEPRLFLARDFYVDAHAPSLNPTGSSWELAYQDLQLALTQASPGDRILVADGTYTPTPTPDRTKSFVLKNNVQLLGAHAGYGAPNPNARDTTLYPSILSGNINDPGTDTDNSYHVVVGSNTDASALLDGFTITAGNAGTSPNDYGGGMYNSSGSPTLRNCTFADNSADWCAGGMYNLESSSPTLINCLFTSNSATFYGGAMYNFSSSSPTLINCTFTGNTGAIANFRSSSPTLTNCTFTGNSTPYSGGAIWNFSDCSPILTNCTFTGNSAGASGGAMQNSSDSSPAITNCTFTGNSAGTSGGAMQNSSDSSPAITNCTFTDNSAIYDGGAMCNSSSSLPILINCTFTDNSARNFGGAMDNSSSSLPTLINCIVTGNSADHGGALSNRTFASPVLINCTFSGNSVDNASGSGGGVIHNSSSASPTFTNCTFIGNSTSTGGLLYNSNSSSPTLINCILWANTPQTIYNTSDSTTTIRHSLIQGGYKGPGNLNADPQFLRNPSPGPDTQWGTSDDDYGDLRLRLTSPALDAGDNTALPASLTTDLAGNPRFADIPSAPNTGLGTSPLVDLGAYEAQSLTLHLQGRTFVRLSPDQLILDLWSASPPTGSPDYAQPLDYIAAIDFAAGAQLSLSGATLPQVESWLRSQRLFSSSKIPHTTLAPFPQPDGSILVKQTYFGDVNGDGQVNLTDYFTIDSGYLNQRQGFTNGDANLDGEINLTDYTLIDSAYLNQKPPLASSSSFTRTKQVLKAPKKKPKTKPTFSSKKRIH